MSELGVGSVSLSSSMGIEELVRVAREGAQVAALDSSTRVRVEASRDVVRAALARPDKAVYGITTGYGSLANTRIPARPTSAGLPTSARRFP